jgi:vancomycin resistance protein VanJ
MIASIAVLSALVMLLHPHIPNRIGNLGSLVETFLPWMGLIVPLLLAVSLAHRSAAGVAAVVLPALAWLSLFGTALGDKRADGGDLTIVTHNVNDENPDPKGTALALAASGADLVALEELSASTTAAFERALTGKYRYHSVQGSVGLWSRYPMRATRPVDITALPRALRSTVQTPKGTVTVFVAHLPSVRVNLDAGFTAGQRDVAARLLADAIRNGSARGRSGREGSVRNASGARTILVGDFNGTTDDRALSPLTSQMRSAQDEAGDGFGFSWPSTFPVARIDQILVKGVKPVSSWTLPATGSDHLPVAATVEL